MTARWPIVRIEHPAQRAPSTGWCVNPPTPFAVRACETHGEFLRRFDDDSPAGRRCYSCTRAAGNARAEARKPPAPPYSGKKTCRLCGLCPVPGRRLTWCSDDCVQLWSIATNGDSARFYLTRLHGYWCWACGAGEPDRQQSLDVDHIRPLWSLTDDQRLELRWWLPFNLQLLCPTCHRDKTSWEAGLRAAVRRGECEWTPWPGPGVAAYERNRNQLTLDLEVTHG